jgi:hypothetical protein
MQNLYSTSLYKKAFLEYIRKGTPIDVFIKNYQTKSSGQYIWRTREDGKVRLSHQANNGKVFSFDSPPETGNPGEDYGSRCTAEAYIQGESEVAFQNYNVSVYDNPRKWTNYNFLQHFRSGGGNLVTLSETGHLAGVVNHYFYEKQKDGELTYNRINAQIIDAARNASSGLFTYNFNNSYDFGDYLFVFGDSTVSGVFVGTVNHRNDVMYISGKISYVYKDVFTDPASVREDIFNGSSDPDLVSDFWRSLSDGGGTYFTIYDTWSSEFKAEVKRDKENSVY